jgi:hypothetical protein
MVNIIHAGFHAFDVYGSFGAVVIFMGPFGSGDSGLRSTLHALTPSSLLKVRMACQLSALWFETHDSCEQECSPVRVGQAVGQFSQNTTILFDRVFYHWTKL